MSDSDDPRFRIPRGSSDEEIDSDLASIASDELPAAAPVRADRTAITAAATSLRPDLTHRDAALVEPPLDDDASDPDDEADDAALSAVVYAATGRKDLSNAHARAAREVLPAGEEREGALPVVGRGKEGGGQQEMMDRMLSVLGERDVGGLGSLKKKVARLSSRRPLNVPLAEPVAERISRGVVYDEMKDEVTEKWGRIIVENRKKPRLVFPLDGERGAVGRNSGNVVERFKAENEYEREIDSLLKEAGVGNDDAVVKEEEKGLGEMKVSKKEIMERRREMARVRSMMFHYEQKMKRIAKIKSRKYRRILKKEKEKIKEMDRGDNWEQEEMISKERRRAEERMTLRHKNTSKWVRRQLTRGEGKRNENTRAAIEDQLRLHEKLKERQERLMDESDDSENEGSIGDGATEQRMDEELEKIRQELEEDGREPEREKRQKRKGLMGMRFMQAAEERQRKQAQELLEQMDNEGLNSGEEDKPETPQRAGRRSFAGRETKLKKAGGKRQRNENARDVGGENEEVDYSLSEGEEGDVSNLKERVLVGEKREEEEEDEEGSVGMYEDEGLGNGRLGEALRTRGQVRNGFTTRLEGRLKAEDAGGGRDGEDDRGLEGGGEHAADKGDPKKDGEEQDGVSRKGEEKEVDLKDGFCNGIVIAKIEKTGREQNAGEKNVEGIIVGGQDRVDATVEQAQVEGKQGKEKKAGGSGAACREVTVSEDKGLNGLCKGKKRRTRRKRVGKVKFADEKEEKETEEEGVEVKDEWKIGENSERGGGIGDEEVSKMRFVAEAFAGAGGADEEEFAALKRDEIEREAPTGREIGAEVLPGWGQWDGAGMRKNKKGKMGNEREESAFAKAARERLAAAREHAVKRRSDGGLEHVILEERRVKRAAELTLASVPFPFRSAEEWGREVEVPVCREFVSGRGFGDGIRRKVEKKVGVVIEPIRMGTCGGRRESRKRKRDEEVEQKFEGQRGVLEMRKRKAREREKGRRGLMVGK